MKAQASIDLTQRIQRENLLVEAQKKLGSIIHTSLMGVWEVDSSFKTVYVNQRMADILGSTPAQILGCTAHDFIPTEDREILSSRLKIREKGQIEVYETRIQRHDDGTIRDVVVNATPLFDSNGKFQGIIATLLDVNASNRTEVALRESQARLFESLKLAALGEMAAKLQESEQLLSTILYSLPLAVFGKDINNNFQWTIWNKEAENLFGVKAKDCIGRPDSDFFPPDQVDFFRAKDIEAIQSREIIDIPAEFAQTLQGVVIVHTRKTVIPDAAGEPRILLGISEDITIRKQMETELSENRTLLFNSFNKSPLLMTISDLATGKYLEVNDTFCRVSGYTRQEAIGRTSVELGWLSEGERARLLLELQQNGKVDGIELALQTSGGKAIFCKFWGEIIKTTQGNRLFSVAEDISERKISEQDLKTTQRNLAEAQRISHMGSYVWNLQTGVAQFSDEIYRIYGLKVGDTSFTLETTFDRVHPDDRTRLQETIQEDVRIKRPHTSEHRILLPSGNERWVHCEGEFVLDTTGSPLRMLGTIQDVTQRKQLEADLIAAKLVAEDSAKTKARFLDTAAHELRNPITAISLMVHVAQKQLEKGQAITSDTLSSIREPVDRLNQLVGDLLDISQVERGLVVLRPVRSDIVALVASSLEEFQLRAPLRRFVFTRPQDPLEFIFDPVRINQVLSNLLDNALKYTNDDSPIEVTIATLPDGIRVSVVDRGAGIPKEKLAHLFSAFNRGDSNETLRASSGLGLGLSVCRGIMELHGGKIGVLSEVGRGSTFYFELSKNGAVA